MNTNNSAVVTPVELNKTKVADQTQTSESVEEEQTARNYLDVEQGSSVEETSFNCILSEGGEGEYVQMQPNPPHMWHTAGRLIY